MVAQLWQSPSACSLAKPNSMKLIACTPGPNLQLFFLPSPVSDSLLGLVHFPPTEKNALKMHEYKVFRSQTRRQQLCWETKMQRAFIFAELWENSTIAFSDLFETKREKERKKERGQEINLQMLNNHMVPSVALLPAIISNTESFIPSFYFLFLL